MRRFHPFPFGVDGDHSPHRCGRWAFVAAAFLGFVVGVIATIVTVRTAAQRQRDEAYSLILKLEKECLTVKNALDHVLRREREAFDPAVNIAPENLHLPQ